jgi:hypothetical protein
MAEPFQIELPLVGGGTDVVPTEPRVFGPKPNPLRDQAALNSNLAIQMKSSTVAKNLSLSSKTGLSLPFVETGPELAEEEAKKMEFRAIDEAALLGFISQSPENAALVKDDLPVIRRAVREVEKAQSYFGRLDENISKAVQAGEARLSLVEPLKRKYFFGDTSPENEEQIKRLKESAPTPEFEDIFGETAVTTAEQFPLFKSTLGTGLETVVKGGALVLATGTLVGPAAIPIVAGGAKALFAFGRAREIFEMEAVFAADEFSEFKDEKGNPLDPEIVKYAALVSGYLNAGIEFTGDFFTLGLLQTIPGFSKLVSLGARRTVRNALKRKTFLDALRRISVSAAGTTAIEGIEEGMQETVTILAGEAAKEISEEEFKEADLRDVLGRILGAGRKGLLGGLGFSTITSSVSVGATAMNQAVRLQQAKSVKERPKQFYQDQIDISEALEGTIIKEKNPAKMKELLRAGRMTQDVLVDGREAQDFYQIEDNSKLFSKLRITEEKVKKLAAAGQTIPLELAEIHAALSLEESRQFFLIVKEHSESLSLKDSQTINLSEELKIVQEQIEEINREEDAFQQEKDRIEQEIFKAAKIRKIVRPTQTKAYAKAVTELMGAFAQRMSIEGEQDAATTLSRISTEIATFKDIKDAQKFIGANDLNNTIPLGVTKIHPEGFIIKLFEDANPSTLLHETGHVFFNEVLSLVNMKKASEDLIKDFDVVKEWLKVDSAEGITLKQQDKFARAFELYLREGKSPSAGLTPFFERFKKWLLTVYEKIKGTPIDVDLNDDVRGVFDRLLTVGLQTEEFVEQNEFVTSERIMEKVGLSEEEKLLFRRLMKGMTATAKKELQQRLAKEHKKNIKEWTREAEIEVAGKRVNNLFTDLTSSQRGLNLASSSQFLTAKQLNELAGKFPDVLSEEGMDPKIVSERFGFAPVEAMFKSLTQPLPSREVDEGAFNKAKELRTFLNKPILGLDQREVEFQFGRQTAVRLKAKNARLVRKDGQSPQEVALEYGYDSINEMIKELETVLPRKEQVAQSVAQKEKAHYINFNPEGAFLNWNDNLAKFFKTMGGFLARKAGVEVGKLRQTFKEQAEKEFSSETVGRASRTDRYLSDLRKNLRERDKAIRKGDFKEATEFHERARLSYEFARKSNQVKNARRDLKNLTKRAGKSKGEIEFDYWKNIVSLSNKYNLRTAKEPQNVPPFQNLLDKQKSLLDAGVSFGNWIEAEKPTNFLDLSVARFSELKTLIEVLDFYGRKIIADDTVLSNMKFAELKQALLERIEQRADKKNWDSRSVFGKLTNAGQKFFSDVEVLHSIAARLDGHTEIVPKGEVGPWGKLIEQGFKADSEYLKINGDIKDRIKPALDQLGKSFSRHPKIISEIKVPVPENMKLHNRNWYFDTVISVALNMGNRGNIDALKAGYGLSESDLINITSVLTKEDWKAIKLIGGAIGTLRDPLFVTKKKMTNFEPTKIEPDPSLLPPNLNLKGWYYPLKRDLSLMSHALGLNVEENFMETQLSAVPDGPTRERQGFGGKPVKLDLSTLAQHIHVTAMYISHAEYIKDMNRIFSDAEISNAIIAKIGLPALNSAKNSLNNIARGKYEEMLTLDRWFHKLRGLSTIYILGLRFKVAIKQFFSTFIFMSRFGIDTWIKGTAQVGKGLLTWNIGDLIKDMRSMSSFMKNRGKALDTSISESIRVDLLEKPIPFAFGLKNSQVDAAMFALITGMDFVTVLPQWLGAFQKGKKQFKGDIDKAVAFADKAIRTTQPSFRPIDLSPLQTSRNGVSRAVTMFFTAAAIVGRSQRLLFGGLMRGEISLRQFSRAFFLEFMLTPILMNFLFAALRGEMPELEDVLWDIFVYQFFGTPLLRDASVILSNWGRGRRYGTDWDSPLFTPFELGTQLMGYTTRLIQDLDDDKKWKNVVLSTAELFSFFLKKPIPRLGRDIVKGMERIERGDSTPIKVFKTLVPPPPPEKKKKK